MSKKTTAKDDIRQLTGAERSAIIMLSLGEEHSSKIWKMMDEDEIKEVSQVMSTLGTVSSSLVEKLLVDFVSQMSGTGSRAMAMAVVVTGAHGCACSVEAHALPVQFLMNRDDVSAIEIRACVDRQCRCDTGALSQYRTTRHVTRRSM